MGTRTCLLALLAAPLCAAPSLRIVLPERTRLLAEQRVDLTIELRGASGGKLRVTVDKDNWSSRFGTPALVDLDCDGKQDQMWRAPLQSFAKAGRVRLEAAYESAAGTMQDAREIEVFAFEPARPAKNIVIFIGDAMGNAYRDAARIVSRSVPNAEGRPGLHEGFYERLLEMDQMPVTGLVLTHALDQLVPDSSCTASAWSTGNKTVQGASGVFPDGTDCHVRRKLVKENLQYAYDNPRIETLWEYLKRRSGYRTGVVTTAYVTDATPAGEGAHIISRNFSFEIARQFRENPLLNGEPSFDVLLGGGLEDFEAEIRTDKRDLVAEFRQLGYQISQTATELRQATEKTERLLGLFKRAAQVKTAATGIRASANGNLNTAYDRLKLRRPGSEPLPSFGVWTDQPFLREMTEKALQVLSGPRGERPFVLLVEGASIDKQSHQNHAAGTIWDAIELDQAVGAARAWSKARKEQDTLVLVTADHDQSMTLLGVTEISDESLTRRTPSFEMKLGPEGAGQRRAKIYSDAGTNVRALAPYIDAQDPNASGAPGPPGAEGARAVGGFPDYQDENGDGYPENREVNGKGKRRLSVGFRTGGHTATAVPVTAEGPGAFFFTGYLDQTDLMFKMAAALGDTRAEDRLLQRMEENRRNPRTPGREAKDKDGPR